MKETILKELRQWFDRYVDSFGSSKADLYKNLRLKKDHTKMVCGEILNLGRKLHLSKSDLIIAEISALFHDTGRFEQYARYGTFVDQNSENHALLGVEILEKNSVLDRLDKADKEIIIKAVKYHNLSSLPKDEDDRCIFFAKLLRDADKLDIYRVVIEYFYLSENGDERMAVQAGVSNTPGVSEDVSSDMINGKILDIKDVKTLDDFKLFQISWVYDINFDQALKIINDRGYLTTIYKTINRTETTDRIFSVIQSYVDKRISH